MGCRFFCVKIIDSILRCENIDQQQPRKDKLDAGHKARNSGEPRNREARTSSVANKATSPSPL